VGQLVRMLPLKARVLVAGRQGFSAGVAESFDSGAGGGRWAGRLHARRAGTPRHLVSVFSLSKQSLQAARVAASAAGSWFQWRFKERKALRWRGSAPARGARLHAATAPRQALARQAAPERREAGLAACTDQARPACLCPVGTGVGRQGARHNPPAPLSSKPLADAASSSGAGRAGQGGRRAPETVFRRDGARGRRPLF